MKRLKNPHHTGLRRDKIICIQTQVEGLQCYHKQGSEQTTDLSHTPALLS